MKVASWMSPEVVTCRSDQDLSEAARLMWDHDCGILPVVDGDGRVIGTLTDRDALMGAFLGGRALGQRRVAESMSKRAFTCLASDRVEDVIRLMADQRIRRVPVVDGGGRVVGMISLADLVRGLVGMLEVEERHRLSTRLIEALACLSEPWHVGPEAVEVVTPKPVPMPRAKGRATRKAR